MSKAKIIAVCGICSAIASLCLLLVSFSALRWFVLPLAIVASVAVALPMFFVGDNLKWSLLTYFACLAVSVAIGALNLSNVVYVAPVVTFCMPFAIVKVRAESQKTTIGLGEKVVFDDPFDGGDDRVAVKLEVTTKNVMSTWAKWLIYYALLEVSLAITSLLANAFSRSAFMSLYESGKIWILFALAQVAVLPLDALMRGCFVVAAKAVRKSGVR